MSTTKKIYFLSAIVLIIGCFALNLSYSLFVQTEEKDIVSASVPNLASSLATTEYTIPTGEYFIKQTVYNNGTADMLYALNVSSTSTNYTIKAVNEGTTTYNSYGTLEANTSKDLYFYIKNENSSDINLSFSIDKKYTTLNNDLTSNIDNEEPYTINFQIDNLPYSDNVETLTYNIIQKDVRGKIFNFNENNISAVKTLDNLYPELSYVSNIETENVGLYQAADDYGTSYYYRGAQSYNYVNFAGFTWRIVRINGDGTIRMILDGSLDKIKPKDEYGVLSTVSAGNISAFNTNTDDNAYIGYMYGQAGSGGINSNYDTNRCLKLSANTITNMITTYPNEATCLSNGGKWTTNAYEATHVNIKSSVIKEVVDNFYFTYIDKILYRDFLADTLFCGDKTLADNGEGNVNTQYGVHQNTTYYSASSRLGYFNKLPQPTLECAKNQPYNYSRYTANSTITTKNISVNNDLTYPIGLLSADELVMAGAYKNIQNDSYYLSDAYKKNEVYDGWWTMTPYGFNRINTGYQSYAYDPLVFASYNYSSSYPGSLRYTVPTKLLGIRPVINLKSDVLVDVGEGTENSPYKVKLSSNN